MAKKKTEDVPAAPPAPRKRTIAVRKKTEPVATHPNGQRVVTDNDIRMRAYFLSIELQGRGHSEMDFWLLAERELRQRSDESR